MCEQTSNAVLEREYSPSSVAPDFPAIVSAYASRSSSVLETTPSQRLSYGTSADEYAIVFAARARGRHLMVVFIHGGYWQDLAAEDSCFPAKGLLAQGISYAALNYTLAPSASIAQIVDQCAAALHRISSEFPDATLVLAGSSAGAHLAAMLATMEWSSSRSQPRVAGFILISGIYDLRPLTRTYINKPLNLDLAEAKAMSPAFLPVRHPAPTLVCWGEHETSEFKRQSAEHARRLVRYGVSVELLEVSGRNHFDILFDLADPATQLGKAVDNLFGDL